MVETGGSELPHPLTYNAAADKTIPYAPEVEPSFIELFNLAETDCAGYLRLTQNEAHRDEGRA